MFLNKDLKNFPIFCLNLTTRPDRKKHVKLQAKNHNLDKLQIITVKPNKDPKKGCLLAHLNVIKKALDKNYPYIMILEDDFKIIRSLKNFPLPPSNWDMLYFGGTVHNNLGKYDENWNKIATWTCHAYLLNLQNKSLINDILNAEFQDKEIDEYFIKNVHHKYNVYMVNPMRIIQRDGFSDIERAKITYDFMEGTLQGFKQPVHEKLPTGEYVLKLDFVPPELLPNVSIITPTYERRAMFPIAINNFLNFNYPKEKLEWIIVDDSKNIDESVSDIIPKDKRIRYIHIKTTDKMSVAHKRNIACNEAKYDYIVHMDDDDYYPPESIMARIKLLLKYKDDGVGCVGCSRVGIYDVMNNTSSIATDGMISLSEASMAYMKEFWEKQNFNELEREGEYRSFIHGRFNQIMDMPYSFVIYAMSHKGNFTGTTKRIDKNVLIHKDTGNKMNFYDQWDEEVQELIDGIRKNLKKMKI